MSYVKNYDIGISKLDDTYQHYVHELPLLSFGDARNTFALSLVFQSKLTSNPFYIANGYKLNIQKRIVFSGGYPQSYEDGNGALVKLNRFGNKYAFDDGSQRIIRLINGQYILENPDYSSEIFNTSGNILSAKDKYGNTILSYAYSSGKLVSVVYKNRKTVTFGYNNNAMQYIQYIYSNSTFKTTFTYSDNNIVVSHYSGVDYHFDYTDTVTDYVFDNYVCRSKTLTVYSTNRGEGFSNDYSCKNIATEESDFVTNKISDIIIQKFHGNKKIDSSHYSIISRDADGNIKTIHEYNPYRVCTAIQFEKGKPAYSYEALPEMFLPHPNSNEYFYYPGKVTFYNNDKAVGYQNYNDGIPMECCNAPGAVEPNSYVLMHNLSGMMTVSGWLKPKAGTNINECKISISGTDNIEKYSYWVTGLTEDIWTYFSVSFYMENDIVVHARTNERNSVVEARDFRVSAQEYSAEELKEYRDNLIKSAGVLIHTDGNGVDHPIAITDNVEFLNGTTIINQDTYPITINDLMRFKTNQKIGTNTGEIYYNDGRGILTLSGTFYVKYCTSEGSEISVSLENLAIGKMHTSKGNEYVTKTNFYVEGGATKLKTQSIKNSHETLRSEIYNSKLDLIKSNVKGVITTYNRNATNGLLESQTISSPGNDDITFSAVYDANEFLISTTDEFGITTTYTTNDVWGVVTHSTINDGMTVTDTFDDDYSTLISRKFSDDTDETSNEFGYENGFITSITSNALNYTIGYSADFVSSIMKNNLLIGEFETTRTSSSFANEYDGDNETSYYPNSDSPEYTITQKYDDYGRLREVTGLLKNVYDIAPVYTNGTYTTRRIKNSSAKLASRNDFATGNTTKYAYENDRVSHIGEFDSYGMKVNEEIFTYDAEGKLICNKYVYSSTGNYVQRDYAYVTDEDSVAVGIVSDLSNKINGTEKAKTVNTYDTSGRISQKKYSIENKTFFKNFEYNKTRMDKVIDSVSGTTQYEYDSMGRISKEMDGNENILRSYVYDSYGQLIRENNKSLDKTFVYEYNNIGNVVAVKTYAYTTGALGSMIPQQNFGYDTTYPDRLTSFGGTSVNYNSLGCPTTYNGYTTSWTRGKLSKLTKGIKTLGIHNYYYSYNALGQRTSKGYTYSLPTLNTSAVAVGMLTGYSHTFSYDQSGRLVYESKLYQYHGEMGSSDRIVYLYDEAGIIGIVHTSELGTSTTYYFQRNLLGDVIGIYNTSGTKVGGYAYDAWGNCTITLNTNGIATRNPIRYRGYYYDEEANLYYLNARYYSPTWRRFISPDDTAYLDPDSVNGLNLYCYCNNDPVNYVDPSGNAALTIGTLLLIGFVSGAAIGAASSVAGQYIANGFSWDNFSVGQLVLDTVLGGVSGLLSMSTLGLGAMVAANAGIGFIGAVGGHLINGSDFSKLSTWLDIGLSTGLGALVGRIGGAGALNAGYLNGAKQTAGFIRAAGLYDDVLTKAANGFYRTSGIAANALRLSHYNLVVQWNKMIVKQAGNALAKALGYGGVALLIGTAGKGLLYDIYNDYF